MSGIRSQKEVKDFIPLDDNNTDWEDELIKRGGLKYPKREDFGVCIYTSFYRYDCILWEDIYFLCIYEFSKRGVGNLKREVFGVCKYVHDYRYMYACMIVNKYMFNRLHTYI
jgi:hypothetical protein